MTTPLLNDTFTGAGNLSAHTSESGHSWSALFGAGGTSPVIMSDGTLNGNGSLAYWVSGDVATADGESTTLSFVWTPGATSTIGAILRGSTSVKTGYSALLAFSAAYYRITFYRNADGSQVGSASGNITENLSVNTLKFTATGTGASVVLNAIINDNVALTISATDSTAGRVTTLGKAGVAVYTNTALGVAGKITAISAEQPGASASLTLSGPSTGVVGAASANFTVTMVSGTGDVSFTPTSDSGTGTFSPTSVALTVASPSATFTYTPTSAGARNISGTNDGGLFAPTSVAYTATSADSITQTEQTASRIYQRVEGGTTKSIVFAGTYGGTLPTSVEVKIVNATGGATVQDWTALSAAAISGGAWSGSLSVPQGAWYNFISRTKNGATVLATAEQSSNSFGVGVLVAVIGQSNAQQMFGTGVVGNTHTKQYNESGWATCSGFGAGIASDRLQVALNIPIGMLDYGVNGAGLYAGPTPWINTNAGSSYDLFKTGLIGVGSDCEFVLWLQGEADAQVPVTKANYKTALTTLYSRIKSDTGRASLKFGCYLLGHTTAGVTVPEWDAIRQGHLEWIRDTLGAFILGSAVELPLADVVHFSSTGFDRIGRRAAQAILKQLGSASYGADGPRILTASRVGAVITIPVTHDAGTVLKEPDGSTDGGALTGIEVSNDDFATTLTISSTEFSGSNIVITLSSVPTGTTKVRYQYGANPIVTNPVYDNTAPGGDTIGLPLQPTIGVLTATDATKTATIRLVDEAGSPLSNLTGIGWSWSDSPLAGSGAAKTDYGTGETTDASGFLSVTINNSTLTSGQIGRLDYDTSDGTTTQSPSPRGWAGPVAVD